MEMEEPVGWQGRVKSEGWPWTPTYCCPRHAALSSDAGSGRREQRMGEAGEETGT